MRPSVTAGLLTAAIAGALILTRKTPRFVGDEAEVGDTVFVPMSSLPPGGLPIAFPPQAGAIAMIVDGEGTNPDTLHGRITEWIMHEIPTIVRQPLPTPPGPIAIDNMPRSAVTSVWRGGRQV
jgi:hypothetical protein